MGYSITTDGLSPYRLISAANDNASVIKQGTGQLHMLTVINTSATLYYLKLYDKAGTPTASDVPVHTYPIPAGTSGNGFILSSGSFGEQYNTGIAFRITSGGSDADTGACAAGAVYLNARYK
ncbi:MAG: hypothetical protein EOP56_08280 [Sphingobacteriales bacterium]|nr:MAG: hypothetical protein EOP56_08280 [Sphingobacteriales bacterium]